MSMWRCPHCGTPQAETARCWVCRRSSTACGTCRNFRHSVAGSLGYCGLDRGRQPLVGDEIRACWEAWPAGAAPAGVAPLSTKPAASGAVDQVRVQPLAFVEVGPGTAAAPPAVTREFQDVTEDPEASPVPVRPRDEPGWSLWAELER